MADPIDYNALAAQARGAPSSGSGAIDYTALAGQARGNVPAAPKTDDEIIRAYGYDPAVIAKAHLYRRGDVANANREPSMETSISAPFSDTPGVGADVVHPLVAASTGVMQFGAHILNKMGIASDADAQYQDLLTKILQDRYRADRPNPSTVANLLGALLLPAPGGAGKTVAGAVAKGALTGAAASAMQPVDVAGPGGGYFAPKLGQTAIGAATGGAMGGAASAVARGAAKLINARTVQLPEEIAAADAAAAARNAAATHAGTQQAVAGETARLQSALQNTPFEGAADVAQAAAGGDKAAQALQTQMGAASTPAQIQQASIGLANWRTRQTSEALYDKVWQAVQSHPEMGDVPLDETEQAISDTLDHAQKAKDPDVHLINLLKTVQKNIGAGPDRGDELVDNSYNLIRQFRSELGDRISAMRTGTGKQLLGPSSAAALQGVRDAVDTDLRNYTAAGAPDVQAAADAADKYYAQTRVPFKASDVAKAGAPNLAGTTTDAEADQIFGKFIQAGKGDKAQRFFDALDPRGRAAVQYQMAADAMNQATDNVRGAFDPENFFNALDKTQEARGVFFKGPDKAAMDGLKNLSQQAVLAADKADAAAKVAAQTKRPALSDPGSLPLTLLGAGAGGLGLTATGHPVLGSISTAAGLAIMARRLMLTDAGRRILAASSDLTPGSPALARLYDTVSRQLPAATARAATAQ
jgi:hypothetical protein